MEKQYSAGNLKPTAFPCFSSSASTTAAAQVQASFLSVQKNTIHSYKETEEKQIF